MRALLIALAVCGCTDDRTILGCLEDLYPPQIDAPATARVGQPFAVQLTTYGGLLPDTCVASGVRTDVDLHDDGADIWPYDRRADPNDNCIASLMWIGHPVTLTFAVAGSKTLRFHGRRFASRDAEMIEVPVTVDVQ